MNSRRLALIGILAALAYTAPVGAQSVARIWNEETLEAIRHDYARPTVHARNLFHTAVAMWDAWAAYDPVADPVLHDENATAVDIVAARNEAISYAAYRILSARFASSPGASTTLPSLDGTMDWLGYDRAVTTTEGNSPAAVGNRVAETILAFGLTDGSNEQNNYENLFYEPVNEPLIPDFPGNPDIEFPNRWQPLALQYFIDQSGNPVPGGYPDFLSPEWGIVSAFSLSVDDLTIYPGPPGFDWWVFHDPGPPPQIGGIGDALYKEGFKQVVEFSSTLTPDDGIVIDISPASLGNNTLGTNDGFGYDLNPVTGLPYEPQLVPRGDYTRVLAEFWADGPDSETPPGHWFTIFNYVADHPGTIKRIGGTGPVLSDLEWDLKGYLAMGGAMHDAAVAAWGVKGYYDFIRPISAIRYMADRGQSTDRFGPSYDPDGIPLEPGFIEVVTDQSCQPGERHEHLADHIGKIAIFAWAGHVENQDGGYAGVEWILAENWWPYQRPTFVTPPFAGYVSGHSTFSRAAAKIMSEFTGSEFFPGGLGEFYAPQNQFLVFEDGPSVDVTLQWAKYYDAADECSLSRIYGGIHPTADDIPGRFMGDAIGTDAIELALDHYEGRVTPDAFIDGFERGTTAAWSGTAP